MEQPHSRAKYRHTSEPISPDEPVTMMLRTMRFRCGVVSEIHLRRWSQGEGGALAQRQDPIANEPDLSAGSLVRSNRRSEVPCLPSPRLARGSDVIRR